MEGAKLNLGFKVSPYSSLLCNKLQPNLVYTLTENLTQVYIPATNNQILVPAPSVMTGGQVNQTKQNTVTNEANSTGHFHFLPMLDHDATLEIFDLL